MSKILVIAEHLHGKLNPATARAVSAAIAVKPEAIDVLVLADSVDAIAAEAAKIEGVSRVLTVARPENAHALAAVLAPQVAKAATGYSHVFAPSTTFGKDLAPRVAAHPRVTHLHGAALFFAFLAELHACERRAVDSVAAGCVAVVNNEITCA